MSVHSQSRSRAQLENSGGNIHQVTLCTILGRGSLSSHHLMPMTSWLWRKGESCSPVNTKLKARIWLPVASWNFTYLPKPKLVSDRAVYPPKNYVCFSLLTSRLVMAPNHLPLTGPYIVSLHFAALLPYILFFNVFQSCDYDLIRWQVD